LVELLREAGFEKGCELRSVSSGAVAAGEAGEQFSKHDYADSNGGNMLDDGEGFAVTSLERQ
jgi:hypothetical protein